MSHLKELVQAYTVKKDFLIKKICDPLKTIGIPIFSYFRIEPDGRFGNLSNYPEELEFFYEQSFHLNYPYLIHPCLLRSGCIFTTVASNASSSEKVFNKYRMFYLFIILERTGDVVEGFVFAPENGLDAQIVIDFLPKLGMFYTFIRYFKKKAHSLIENMMKDGFNLKEAKGEDFFKVAPSLPLASQDAEVQKFLRLIFPLTERERQCLDLFKQGKSAQATAAILGLSQRTVEHYLDSVKDKLGCQSKWELLEW